MQSEILAIYMCFLFWSESHPTYIILTPKNKLIYILI